MQAKQVEQMKHIGRVEIGLRKLLIPVLCLCLVMLSGVVSAGELTSFLSAAGPVAEDQRLHFFRVIAITMVAVAPVLLLLPIILVRYRRRRGNKAGSAAYRPTWDFSLGLEVSMWGVPFLLVAILSAYLWHSTHTLDPYAKISSPNPTVEVQVVGLDWKWLFIYPKLGIAAVGEMAMPVDHPVSMTLTTDTVMQSFVIPALAGQIYAMPGMATELNLVANIEGDFHGENTQYNGNGFVDQNFIARSKSVEQFQSWVEQVRNNGIVLTDEVYASLAKPGSKAEAYKALGTTAMPAGMLYFKLTDPHLFHDIVSRYHSDLPIPSEYQPGSPDFQVNPQAKRLLSP